MKLKVVKPAQELTVDLIKKLCFARPIISRRASRSAAAESEVEETKSETTAATAGEPS